MFSHLIIDGYNIIHKWTCLKKAKGKNLEFARQALIEIIKKYADYSGIKVTVVFDGRNDNATTSKDKDKKDSPNIIFSKRPETADSIIEKLVYDTKDKKELLVATDDHCQQNMVFGMGSFFISSSELEKKIASSLNQMREGLLGARKKIPSSKIPI